MISRRLLALALSLASAFSCAAEPVCYQYRVSGFYVGSNRDSGWHSSPSAACSALASSLVGVSGTTSWSASASGDPAGAWYCIGSRSYGGPSEYWDSQASFSHDRRVNPAGCPVDPCADTVGKTLGVVSYADGPNPEPPPNVCATSSSSPYEGGTAPANCGITFTGRGVRSTDEGRPSWGGIYRYSGQTCSGGETPMSDLAGTGNCVSNSSGQACADKSNSGGKNCGTVNGERVCLASVPPGQCSLTPGQAAVCADGAAASPLDAEGQPIPPDFSLSTEDSGGGSTTYNYYSSTTLAGSAGGGGVGGGMDPDGGEGGEEGEGGPGGNGSVCAEGQDCYGEHPEAACLDDIGECAASALTGLGSLVGSIPVVGFIGSLYSSIPTGGTCPEMPLEFFGESHDAMEPVCELLSGGAGSLLELVMRVLWSFAGLRIMLRSE